MCIIGSSWKEDSNNDDIGPIVPSSWKEDINTSKTEYIILDSKEDKQQHLICWILILIPLLCLILC